MNDLHEDGTRQATTLINLLPGPVAITDQVRAAMAAPAISHRSAHFIADVAATKQLLCSLTGASSVELLMGSGTLANDAIAAQLGLQQKPGLILANGEFGRRLAGQAKRAGLQVELLQFPWGQSLAYDQVAQKLGESDFGWLWTNHCETSTGILNELSRLKYLCQKTETKLCLDAISSIGLAPVDLSGVYLASGVSGKGLAAPTGIAMVYYNAPLEPQPLRLPSYLDLGLYAERSGIPFTFSSNLLYALKTAVESLDISTRVQQLGQLSSWCRQQLIDRGITVLAAEAHSAPAVLSMVLPDQLDSYQVGLQLQERGYLISFASRYLVARNIIQLCFFSPVQQVQLLPMLDFLEQSQVA